MALTRIKINNFIELPYEVLYALIDNAPYAIIVIDKNARLIAANRLSRELCGLDYQKMNLEKFLITVKALKPNNIPFPLEEMPLYFTLKSGQEIRNIEMSIQRPNSERFPVSVYSIPIFDENKTIVAVIGVIEEITEHKKVDKTLRENEKRFRTVAQAANVLVYEIFLKESYFAVFTGEEVLGYGKGELPTALDWWLRQIHPDDRKNVKQKLKSAIELGQDVLLEYRFKRKQGDYITIDDTKKIIKNELGKTISIFGGLKDVTKYKNEKDSLKENQERLELAQSVAHMGSWEYYLKEDCAIWSKELYHIFGLDPEKPAPNTAEYLKMFHPDEVEGFAEKSKAFAFFGKLGETLSIDYRIMKPNGEIRDIHSVRMIRNSENGINTRIIGIEQDITERRAIERQLERYSKNLERIVEERTNQLQEKERLATIGETAAMVGHDIRNPLQTIINELYLARQVSSGAEKVDVLDSLNLIQEQVDYISKIVSDLQDYARPLKPEYKETNLGDLLVSTFNAIQVPKDIDLEIKVDDTVLFRTDRVFLKRALTNLVNNAIQAMPQGGHLKLRAYRKGRFVVLTVSDSGQGIPEEVKAHLYKPLVTTKSKGQGFGLPVVKRLVEALGGRISFESELRKGTEFIIQVPFVKE